MHRIESVQYGKLRIPSLGLHLAAIALIAAVLSSSCFFDTGTNLCEASGRRCPHGQVCAAKQDACIKIGGCGDGIVSGDEVCDDGNIINGDGCSSNCRSEETCGNGITDIGESCDDGNRTPGDGCSADCTAEVCGNHIVEVEYGEVCDDGNAKSDDGCSFNCKSNEVCGNGIVDDTGPAGLLHEQCDNVAIFPRPVPDTPDCDSDCTFPMCGDGHLNPMYKVTNDGPDHFEECDSGVMGVPMDSPNCDRDCTFARCGDGYWNRSTYMNMPIEECDHGANNSNTQKDACRTDCREAFCGDGVIDTGEVCDDDNSVNSDLCPSGMQGTCKPAKCGDDHVRTVTDSTNPQYANPEECDDGDPDIDDGKSNSNAMKDACRKDCRNPFCGDGVIDTGEMCDPGGSYGSQPTGCASGTCVSIGVNKCKMCI